MGGYRDSVDPPGTGSVRPLHDATAPASPAGREEPVAWAIFNDKMSRPVIHIDESYIRERATMDGDRVVPLYTRAAPARAGTGGLLRAAEAVLANVVDDNEKGIDTVDGRLIDALWDQVRAARAGGGGA